MGAPQWVYYSEGFAKIVRRIEMDKDHPGLIFQIFKCHFIAVKIAAHFIFETVAFFSLIFRKEGKQAEIERLFISQLFKKFYGIPAIFAKKNKTLATAAKIAVLLRYGRF